MAVSMGLFVVDPDEGPVEEFEFADTDDIAALLHPDSPAGVEIVSGTDEIIIRDSLDDLIEGLCLGGGGALINGASYCNVSFAGFDTAEISANGDTASFTSGGDTLGAPRDESIAALRLLAGRFAAALEKVFPDDIDRRSRIADFAKG